MDRVPSQSRRGKLGSLLRWLPAVAGATAGVWWMVRQSVSKPKRPNSRRDPKALLAAIPGNNKTTIAAVFGPPRASAGFAAVAPAILVKSDYVHAETWYYPLDSTAQTALVVRFADDVALDAELLTIPACNRAE
jgi:hypothetical protein